MEPVKLLDLQLPRFLHMLMLPHKIHKLWLMQLPLDLYLLQYLPAPLDGNYTAVESSNISVELVLTTVFLQLVMELITELTTGLSKTPGEPDGEKKDMSES